MAGAADLYIGYTCAGICEDMLMTRHTGDFKFPGVHSMTEIYWLYSAINVTYDFIYRKNTSNKSSHCCQNHENFLHRKSGQYI
jgi:hypothetical protein